MGQKERYISVTLKLCHYSIKVRIPNGNIHVYRRVDRVLEATATLHACDF